MHAADVCGRGVFGGVKLGSIDLPRSRCTHEPRAWQIRHAVQAHPDATLAELRDALKLSSSLPTLCRALQTLRLRFKKKVLRAAEQDRPDVAQRCDENDRRPLGNHRSTGRPLPRPPVPQLLQKLRI